MSLRNLLKNTRASKKQMVGIVVAVLIVTLGIFFVIRGSNKQRVLAIAFENFRRETSYHVKTVLELSLPAQLANNNPRPIVEVTFATEGDIQEQDNGHPVFVGKMHNEARGRGMVLFADGQLTLLPNTVAFRLESLPALLNPKGNLLEKWTYVEVPTLETKNPDAVRVALENLLRKADFNGTARAENGQSLYYYRIPLTLEDEGALIEAFRQTNSGNRSLQIVTRLLRAHDVSLFEVWVDEQEKELSKIAVTFVKPQAEANAEQTARLSLDFSDYGKQVAIEEPPKELSVRPDVFGRMFGTGEIQDISQQ